MRLVKLLAASLAAAACVQIPAQAQTPVSDQEVSDAYVYLLGRLLVLRQQKQDFERESRQWNKLYHREPGGVLWVNPSLDVVYSEAWVAVDERTCVGLEIPPITGRYYTWHMLNGWGETALNINERTFPQHPSGQYALCLKGAQAKVPAGALRIDLPSKTAFVLARVELGKDPKEATRLQHLMKLTPLGEPKIDPPPALQFSGGPFLGAEAFDNASAVLASEADINPGMEPLQALVPRVEALVRSGAEGRARVEKVIRDQAVPAFQKQRVALGTMRDGWFGPTVGNYGSNYRLRTATNVSGIWANNAGEYSAFVARGLDGDAVYTQTYAKDRLPGDRVRYFWSVTAVDAQQYLVIPNPLGRYLLNQQSPLKYNDDGSLTLVFASRKPDGYPESNWLPTPAGARFNLTYRMYGPIQEVQEGRYFPPPVLKVQ
ncbi:DUF1254 domain-containing protein [Ramlibacter solisilvae]|uniref:DUF1254 domain-containing protein n=1 Tax=Ramlibacter tataouinensis TaxID=94132 RepID=A0A127K057_9BURK|nr:DUF1214 domain-containing protein [Ramlibacter tataouinensis]AMO25515.1 hypothetical protein UC35_16530 [Ramlibacter tataouinensis]